MEGLNSNSIYTTMVCGTEWNELDSNLSLCVTKKMDGDGPVRTHPAMPRSHDITSAFFDARVIGCTRTELYIGTWSAHCAQVWK